MSTIKQEETQQEIQEPEDKSLGSIIDPCQHDCVYSKYVKNKYGQLDEIKCDNVKNEDKCYMPDPKDVIIYNSIDWKLLKINFQRFMEKWLNKPETQAKLTKLVTAYKKQAAESIVLPENKYIFSIKNLAVNKNDKCGDINYAVCVNLIDESDKIHKLNLMHIAFHGPARNYSPLTEDEYTCAYSPIKDQEFVDTIESKEGTGAFHYKIDLRTWPKNISATQIKNSTIFKGKGPFKQFKFFSNKKILQINLDDFIIHANKDGSMPASWSAGILQIHKKIYDSFVTEWNTNIFSITRSSLAMGKKRRTSKKRHMSKKRRMSKKRLSTRKRNITKKI